MTRARAAGAVTTKCPRCAAPLVTQLVGDRAALHVTAELTPLTPAEEAAVRVDRNRLTWCYRVTAHGTPRLTWKTQPHPPDCPHQHVADHACTGPPTAAPAQQSATLF